MMKLARRPMATAARSALPPRTALEAFRRGSEAAADGDQEGGDYYGEDDEYRRAVEFLRDFHYRRAQTLDVIYEEGRDPDASSSSSSSQSRGRSGGHAVGHDGGSCRMLKVRTTGSLLDLLVEAEDNHVSTDRQAPHQPTPSGTGSRTSTTNDAEGEWGQFDSDEDPSSVVDEEDVAEGHRFMQELALRRIRMAVTSHHHHHPHPRRRPRRHFHHHQSPLQPAPGPTIKAQAQSHSM